jgi:hypothetical protein
MIHLPESPSHHHKLGFYPSVLTYGIQTRLRPDLPPGFYSIPPPRDASQILSLLQSGARTYLPTYCRNPTSHCTSCIYLTEFVVFASQCGLSCFFFFARTCRK